MDHLKLLNLPSFTKATDNSFEEIISRSNLIFHHYHVFQQNRNKLFQSLFNYKQTNKIKKEKKALAN